MKIRRIIAETVIMTEDEIRSFVTKYITKKTGKTVESVTLTEEGNYEIELRDVKEEDELGE